MSCVEVSGGNHFQVASKAPVYRELFWCSARELIPFFMPAQKVKDYPDPRFSAKSRAERLENRPTHKKYEYRWSAHLLHMQRVPIGHVSQWL